MDQGFPNDFSRPLCGGQPEVCSCRRTEATFRAMTRHIRQAVLKNPPIRSAADRQIQGNNARFKLKTNQIKVTWNDPTDNYRQTIEYVEDSESIATQNRIIREDLLAFGTTSRGQAHRLGKWKLLSAQNEKETVTFITGLNAAGLRPGDIITVQDADKDRASYSGRVSNTGTRNTSTIPLDRSITLPSDSFTTGFPPELLLIYPEGGAYLNQDSATISSTDFSKGDLIPSVTSSTAAANLGL